MRDILSTVAFFSFVLGIALLALGYYKPRFKNSKAYNIAFAIISAVLGATQTAFAIMGDLYCAIFAGICFYFGTYRSLKNLKTARSSSPKYKNPKKRKFWQRNKPKKDKDKKYVN